MYLSEEINGAYKDWEGGDMIFISSQTGNGKTYLILHEFIYDAVQKEKRILYLVNRKILKEQIEEKLTGEPSIPYSFITVETYQSLEKSICNLGYYYNRETGDINYTAAGVKALKNYADYDIVVCDECHYFLSDSTFNTYTDLSYGWIITTFYDKISVFISATISDVQELIERDNKMYKQLIENTFSIPDLSEHKFRHYGSKPQYDYLNCEIIEKREECIKLILEHLDSKWLFFVDSLDYAKQVKSSLKKELQFMARNETDKAKKELYSEIDVNIISAGYQSDEEGSVEVNSIVEQRKQKSQILIATSVMDNGISLEDPKLKNVILMADTEVEFLQMLGRKRYDGESVNLYIYKYNQEHFIRRYEKYKKIRRFGIQFQNRRRMISNGKDEETINTEMHYWLLDSIYNKKIDYEIAKKITFALDGKIFLSATAFMQVSNMVDYYKKIKDLFETTDDEYAFVKRQLSWMGRSEEDIEKGISASVLDKIQKSKMIIEKAFDEKCGQEITWEDSRDLKNQLQSSLKVLIDAITEDGLNECYKESEKMVTKKSLLDWIKKNERNITDKHMFFLHRYYGINYMISGKKGEGYIIKKIESENE